MSEPPGEVAQQSSAASALTVPDGKIAASAARSASWSSGGITPHYRS
ncbi:hypothetical protein EDD27_4484 [Nonomuraea polychroma]|uniref:Uncharacterized protein n=1 Tax=Nonomuraea polychroma TaxID=46176 RepID=A0A438M840_9ACTN|nr:hypothetical protein EDD27_4484 [Nonomuraea polychroma]